MKVYSKQSNSHFNRPWNHFGLMGPQTQVQSETDHLKIICYIISDISDITGVA